MFMSKVNKKKGSSLNEEDQPMLYFAKVKPEGKIPSKRIEDAGYDIYPCFEDKLMIFSPHETRLVPTGIAAAISSDYYLQVQERGSTGSKGIKYGAGVIDSGYRGEIFVAITNTTNKFLVISKEEIPLNTGERVVFSDATHSINVAASSLLVYPYSKAIAQLIIHRVHNEVAVAEMDYDMLKKIPSERGVGALGASGK